MAGVIGLVQAIKDGAEYGQPGKCYLTAYTPGVLPSPLTDIREFPWPEELSFERSANYANTQIPGGSSELNQWAATSGRSLSLSFKLYRDIRPQADLPGLVGFVINPQSYENQKHNRDIELDVMFLNQFLLPTYKESGGYTIPYPPPLLALTLEGFDIGGLGNTIYLNVESVNENVVRLFPNGVRRVVTVELSCKESMFDMQGNTVLHDRTLLQQQMLRLPR